MVIERRSGGDRRRTITVVVVDDVPLIRSSLAYALADAGIAVVGEAVDAEEAIQMVLDVRPDVVLTAINLPGMSGVELIERLALFAPASKVLVLTQSEQNRVVEAIVAGASGYILKTATPDAIITAVRATANGENVLSPQIAGKLLDHIRDRNVPVTATVNPAASAIRAALTARELEIFTRLASGESNQQIGLQLSLSTNTVSNHIKSILDKLQLENRVQAAVQAVRAGIA
ncbi:MAG TPA: response regulator transcription factor [Solirubrobacteraceae bacterium]|jgi:two-component system NarL family response regulator|nr:response regulator transcription factor [Solirubrobacteraceae bacterium]